MTETNNKYQPTSEDLKRWAELDELDSNAMSGPPLTQEEYDQKLQSVADGSCLQKYLDRLLQQKQETLRKLTSIEETEKILRARITELESFKFKNMA